MKEEQFIKKSEPTWRRLEELERSIKRLQKRSSKDLVNEFFNAYREASHDLSYAKTHFPQSTTVPYLNELVGRCHSLMYERKPLTLRAVAHAVLVAFPKTFRAQWRLILLAFLVFLVGAFLGAGLTAYDVKNANYFLDQGVIDQISSGQVGGGDWNYPLMSAYIMTNNIKVSLYAFVFGILFGLGTLYVLFNNGAMLGALSALVYAHADPVSYWSLILPHGITELLAIFIAGGAGLMLAKGILKPGEYRRSAAVIRQGKAAMPLLLGVVILLVLAGIIEGFITPLQISLVLKFTFAATTAIALAILFLYPVVTHVFKSVKKTNS